MNIATHPPGTTTNAQGRAVPAPLLDQTMNAISGASTPTKLRALLGASVACAVLLWLTLSQGLNAHRATVADFERATPGLVAAQSMKAALCDLDAQVAAFLLMPPQEVSKMNGSSALNTSAAYEAARQNFATALIGAAENISAGDFQRRSLVELQTRASRYEGMCTQALALHRRGDTKGARAYFATAHDYLQSDVLPSAEQLDSDNDPRRFSTSSTDPRPSQGATARLWFLGVATLALLLTAQVWLFKATRRAFNGGLLGATALCGAMLLWAMSALGTSSAQLQYTRYNAQDEMLRAHRARALAFELKADGARALLASKEELGALNDRADAKFAQLEQLLASSSFDSLDASFDPHGHSYGSHSYGYDSAARFQQPYDANNRSLAMRAFYNDDKAMRRDAVKDSGQAAKRWKARQNRNFARLQSALDSELHGETTSYQSSLEAAKASLRGVEGQFVPACVLFLALCVAGVLPRLREYA